MNIPAKVLQLGATKPPAAKANERKGNIKAALEAAYDASRAGNKEAFMDAMEGAMGLAALEE